MSAKMNKIAVFLLFMAFAFVLSVSMAFSQDFPVDVVCNSSNNLISSVVTLADSNTLLALLGHSPSCPSIVNAYPLSASKQILGDNPYGQQQAQGTEIYSLSYDLDQFWALANIVPGPTNVSWIRFVADPFVILNSTSNPKSPFWNFHQSCSGPYGCKKASITCEAQLGQGNVTSKTECLDFFISPAYANCRSDINYDFKCCGDDDLVDPGFEATESDKNLYVWQTEGETCKYSSWCSRVSDASHLGAQSFRITASSKGPSTLKQILDLDTGTYYLSFWIKGTNAPVINVDYPTVAGTTINLQVPAGSYDWKNYAIPFTGTSPNAEIRFVVGTKSGEEVGTVWIDDVHVMSDNKSLTDYGKVLTSTIGNITNYPNLCYYTNSWKWGDPLRDQFKILGVDGFDVISNSVQWSACNAGGIASNVYAGDDKITLTPNFGILNYTPPFVEATIITPGDLGSGGDIYGTGENTLLIPDTDFESGMAILNMQPPGAPEHCFNNDTDEGESDLNCGDGCRKCFIGELCNSSQDCVNGNCQDVVGVKKCTLEIPELNATGYLAQRFICSRMDSVAAYTECCGYSLGLCANKDQRSKIRRAGNPLYDIFEFLPKNPTESKNYALLMGLPLSLPSNYKYYNYPLRMSLADNPLYSWSSGTIANYTDLEFYIASALPDISYLRLLILKNTTVSQFDPTTIDQYLAQPNKVVFSGYISDYVTGQVQGGKWLRVKIPFSSFSSIAPGQEINFISVFANVLDVPEENHVTHAAFNNPNLYFRNVIAIDRISLVPFSSEGVKYCAKYPPASGSGVNGQWIGDMDSNASDVSEMPMGMGVCENTPGFGWTGTECCGNDLQASTSILNPHFVAESYADNIQGCVKGFPLRNNSVMNVSFELGAAIKNTSLMFYNSKFYTCNNNHSISDISTELAFSGTPANPSKSVGNNILDINTSSQYPACYNQGSWYCDFDTGWKNNSAISGRIINTSVNLSNLNATNPPKACCPESWCFYGNTTAPSSCVQSQANVFKYQETLNPGTPYFFNSSKNYSGIKGNNKNYRCINGSWKLAELKWDPNNLEQGYCPELSQCYLDASGCVDSGYFNGDDYCEEGNWSSRTKLVARQLLKIANETVEDLGWAIKRESLYCDKFDEVLTQVDYVESTISPQSARQIISGNNNCPGTNGLACANNFCALTIVNEDGDEKIFLGTSMNIPANTTNAQYSILSLFKEAVYTAGAPHNDFCDFAITLSNSTGNYVGCAYRSSVVSPDKANIWINHKTQTLIYSKEEFDINNTVTSSDVFNQFLRNPLQAIFGWARNLFIGNTVVLGNSEFLNSIADFRQLYISFTSPALTNGKEIRGVVETTTGTAMMSVGYKNVEQNICYERGIQGIMSFGNVGTQSSCNVIANSSGFFQNIYSQSTGYWKDLTTNTRLEGAYTKGGQSANTVSMGSSYGLVLEDQPIVYTINVSGANLSNVLATSIDFGDGTAFSIGGAPENGVWLIEHKFSTKGNKNVVAGIVDNEYKTKYSSLVTNVLVSLQADYYIAENTASEPSNFVLDLTDFEGYALSKQTVPAWFSCEIADYILTCIPNLNKNELTDGMGNISIKVDIPNTSNDYFLNISVHVTPVNTPPNLSSDWPALTSAEDTVPSWTLNLPSFASDVETASSNLSFYLTAATEADAMHMSAFGCHINSSKVLKCNQSESDFAGTFGIRVTAYDAGDGSSPIRSSRVVTLLVNVTQVNDPPILHFSGNSAYTFQAYNQIPLIYNQNSEDIETPSSVSIDCQPRDAGSPEIANITSTDSQLIITTYGTVGIANYSCIAFDNDLVNNPQNLSSNPMNISINVTLTPGIPWLVLNQSNVVNEGNLTKIWIKVYGTPHNVVRDNVTYDYNVLFPFGGVINANLVDHGVAGTPNSPQFFRNLSFEVNESALPTGEPTQTPENNNVYYQVQFNVTDINNMSGYNIADITLNRKPAVSLSIGASFNSGNLRTVYNGSYIFNYAASDIDNVSSIIVYWGDGTNKTLPVQDVYFSSLADLINDALHRYSSSRTYNVTVSARDIYGAISNATYTNLVINDTQSPTATINRINVNSEDVSMNYSSSDDRAVSHCGYVINGNISAIFDAIIFNETEDESNNILWNRLSVCNGVIVTQHSVSGNHNMTFFAVDTMGRMASYTRSFQVDITPPEIISTYPAEGAQINVNSELGSLKNVVINASDNLGLKNITVVLSNETNIISQQTKTFTSTSTFYSYSLTSVRLYENKTYSMDIEVTDNLGNSVSDIRRFTTN